MDIFATPIPTVRRIPQQCRVAVAKAYTTIMSRCCVEGSVEQAMRAWKTMFLFCKCVLRQQPDVRGGKKKKLKRNENLRLALLERLGRWNEGKADVLWAEACKLYAGRDKQTSINQVTANIRRATECAQDARFGKAVAALLVGNFTCYGGVHQGYEPSTQRLLLPLFQLDPSLILFALIVEWLDKEWRAFLRARRLVPQPPAPSFTKT